MRRGWPGQPGRDAGDSRPYCRRVRLQPLESWRVEPVEPSLDCEGNSSNGEFCLPVLNSKILRNRPGAIAEIARSVSQTAEATREVTTNIGGVSTAANETGNAADMVLAAASNLSKQAEQLSGEVGTFLAGVRAA